MQKTKRVAAFMLAIATALAISAIGFVGCSEGDKAPHAGTAGTLSSTSAGADAGSPMGSSANTNASGSTDFSAVANDYQKILDEYMNLMNDAAPKLAAEFEAEAGSLAGDANALADLSNAKIEELAKINNEGMQKMTDIMQSNNDDYSEYEEWAKRLNDVYMANSQLITDAYMKAMSS